MSLSPTIAALVALAALFPSMAAGQPPVPKGERRLAIDFTPAADGDFFGAFNLALSAGMDTANLVVDWNQVETAPGVWNPANDAQLAQLDAFFSAFRIPVTLTLRTIDTHNLLLPPDLLDRPFSDPEVVARFDAALDHVLAALPHLELLSLSIGNEIDVYLAAHPQLWEEYRAFFRQTAAHARTVRPGLPVGAKATWAGLVGHSRQPLLALNAEADRVLVTYYPLDAEFRVRPPSAVPGDVAALVQLYPGRPIDFLEAGYPSGALNDSSQALQRDFVRQLFAAWDAHAGQIGQMTLTWLTDVPEATVQALVDYYGLDDPRFAEYLRTLGLRDDPGFGVDKLAFPELKERASERGWRVGPGGAPTHCVADAATLCLVDGRFHVTLRWEDFQGQEADARVAPAGTLDSGLFYFVNDENWELLVKLVRGCPVDGHFWLFSAAATTVRYTLTVADTATGRVKRWINLPGQPAVAVADTGAFPCP